jgi:hypothetical protein
MLGLPNRFQLLSNEPKLMVCKCKSKHILDTLNPQRHLIGKFSGSKYSCLRPRRITAG